MVAEMKAPGASHKCTECSEGGWGREGGKGGGEEGGKCGGEERWDEGEREEG